jgi:hypothetical protein
VAIELTDELVGLQHAAVAATRMLAPVTAPAEATGQNRAQVEQAVKQAAKD